MNARQKAKHYKKMYERTQAQKQLENLEVHNFKTNIIKAVTFIPYERVKITQESEYIEVIKNELAHNLTKEIKELMDIEVVNYPEQSIYKVYGLIRVVTGIYV